MLKSCLISGSSGRASSAKEPVEQGVPLNSVPSCCYDVVDIAPKPNQTATASYITTHITSYDARHVHCDQRVYSYLISLPSLNPS